MTIVRKISDLLKWHDVLAGESVLNASSIKAMHSRHVDQYFGHSEPSDSGGFYGYGWVTVDKPSGVVHWHNWWQCEWCAVLM